MFSLCVSCAKEDEDDALRIGLVVDRRRLRASL
jgi:hypothetical protein